MRFAKVLLFVFMTTFSPELRAQSSSNSPAHPASNTFSSDSTAVQPTGNFANHYLWTEEFVGSTNSDGQVMALDSSVGYVFSRHFGIDAGIPIYFVRGTSASSTGRTTVTSTNGLGDAYLQVRFAFLNPLLNYKTVFTGTAPTGSTSTGLSTGHGTYDWSNHVDHHFGSWVPFAEVGVGDSIPENFVFHRPFKSFGHDAHFQVGTGYQLLDWVGFSASGYDIAPWGTQTIFSRLVGRNGASRGKGGHGRVFEVANQTTGGSSLAADNGFSVGADLSPGSVLDFSLGYSHSIHFQLDTFSFGIGVNMSQLLHRVHGGI